MYELFKLLALIYVSLSSLGQGFMSQLKKCSTLGTWWLIGKFGALPSQGRNFEPQSGSHLGTLGKSFTRNCLYGDEAPCAAACG